MQHLLQNIDEAGALTRYALLLNCAILPDYSWQTPALKAAALALTTRDKSAIREALQQVPANEIVHTLTLLECVLVKIDLAWTLELIQAFVPAEQLTENASLGLCTAMYLPDAPLLKERNNHFYNYQRQADDIARTCVNGKGKTELQNFLHGQQLADLPAATANALIVAAAWCDIELAFSLTGQLLKIHRPEALQEAVLRLAVKAREAGKEQLITERAAAPGFLSTQVLWSLAMAYSSNSYTPEFHAHTLGLCERVTEEVEQGMEYEAGIPLLLILTYLEDHTNVQHYLELWELSQRELADAVLLMADRRLSVRSQLPDAQDILDAANMHVYDCFPGDLRDLLECKTCI